MAYTSIIGEKRAKDIAKYIVSEGAKNKVKFPALEKFSKEGLSADNVYQPLDELNEKVNNDGHPTRLNYDDSVRLRDYFESFIPSDFQIQVLKKSGKKFDEGGWSGQPVSSGDVTQPVYDKGGLITKEVKEITKHARKIARYFDKGGVAKGDKVTLRSEKLKEQFDKQRPRKGTAMYDVFKSYQSVSNEVGEVYQTGMKVVGVKFGDKKLSVHSDWLQKLFARGGSTGGKTYTFSSHEERGEWTIDVNDPVTDQTLWDYRFDGSSEDETSIIDDGFMKHTDDISGLEAYLKDMKVLQPDDKLVDVSDYEEPEEEIDEDLLEFTIPTWAMSAIVNGDRSGLTDEDEEKLDKFLKKTVEKYGNANFMFGPGENHESEFSWRNDIDGILGADVEKMYLRPDEDKMAKGGKASEIPKGNVLGMYHVKGKNIDTKVEFTGVEKQSARKYVLYQTLHGSRNMDVGSLEIPSSAFSKISRGKTVEATTHSGDKLKITRLGNTGFTFAKGGKIDIDDNEPKIYVADLAAYNNSKLVGEWITITDYSDGSGVMEAITELVDTWKEADPSHEEWAIHDTENIPDKWKSENMSEKDFDEIIEAFKIAEDRNIPFNILAEWMDDTGGSAKNAEDAYYGEYKDKEDFAYDMVEQGVITDLTSYLSMTDTDRRIVAGEESDNYVDNMDDEDELIKEADMEDVLTELEDKRDRKEQLDSEIDDKKEEIQNLETEVLELQDNSDDEEDGDAKELIESEIGDAKERLRDLNDELSTIQGTYLQEGIKPDFDFDEAKTELADEAKETIRGNRYDEIYKDLSDPVQYFVHDQGMYSAEDLAKQNFISVDYDDLAKDLESDFTFIQADGGGVFVFTSNYAKGGSVKPKFANGGSVKSEDVAKLSIEFSRLLWRDAPEEMAAMMKQDVDDRDPHEFLDANMTMFEAFTNVTGRLYEFYNEDKPSTRKQNDIDDALWNRAWNMAIENDYYQGKKLKYPRKKEDIEVNSVAKPPFVAVQEELGEAVSYAEDRSMGEKDTVFVVLLDSKPFAYAKDGSLSKENIFAKGGKVTFKDKVKAISKKLKGKKVKRRYQKDYGKQYSKKEATQAATKIAGAIQRDHGKKAKGGKANDEPLPGINLYFKSFGMDKNGNKVVKVHFFNDRAFSIQTNSNLPKTHSFSTIKTKIKDIKHDDLVDMSNEVYDYVSEHGSKDQKKMIKKYSS